MLNPLYFSRDDRERVLKELELHSRGELSQEKLETHNRRCFKYAAGMAETHMKMKRGRVIRQDGATWKQIKYLSFLLARINRTAEDLGYWLTGDYGFGSSLSVESASVIIDKLKDEAEAIKYVDYRMGERELIKWKHVLSGRSHHLRYLRFQGLAKQTEMENA